MTTLLEIRQIMKGVPLQFFDIKYKTHMHRAREELLSIMKKRFLDGKDSDFVDYAGIDSNSSLDDLKQIQQDAEDRWFDEELPAPCDDLRVR